MKCPVCNIDMIVVEYNKIELDYCMRCAGVWFDSGELNLLLEKVPGKEASLTLVSQAKAAETRRKCPICSQKLDKVTMGGAPDVLLDACKRGDGLWFDGGELTRALKEMTSGKPQSDVLSFLSEVFPAEAKTANGKS